LTNLSFYALIVIIMSVERPILSGKQIARAERREGVSHPVLSVLEQHLPTIIQLNEGYSSLTDNQEQQRYIKKHYGFLADALVEAGPYTLEPTDLIAIWSRAQEVFSGYHQQALAGMVSSVYAIQGAENSEWRKFPRHYLETSQLPEGVIKDKGGLLYVKSRLDQIGESLDDIDFYTYGTREPRMTYAFNLAKRGSEGDEAAKKELERLIAHEKAHQTPVLEAFHANFRNGYIPLYFPIVRALETLQD
jgi:hypothetical protein